MKLEKKLTSYYEQMDQGHDRLRDELMARLPENVHAKRLEFVRSPLRLAARIISSAAAILFVAIGLSMFSAEDINLSSNDSLDVATINAPSNYAWANIADMINRPDSLHCKWTTYNGRSESSLLFWWQQNNYRMEFSNGMVNACNGENYYSYDPAKGKYTCRAQEADMAGPGTFIMDVLGMGDVLPGWFGGPAKKLIDQSKVVSTTETVFKDHDCYRIIAERNDDIIEYVVDRNDAIIYHATQYKMRNGVKTKVSEVEIFELNKPYAEGMFRLP